MTDRMPTPLAALDDERLGAALAELGRSLATPAATRLVAIVRARLPEERPARSWIDLLRPPAVGPTKRAARLAFAVALLLLALIVTAVGAGLLGLPGLRFIFEPSAAPSPATTLVSPAPSSPGPSIAPGSQLGLGDQVPGIVVAERLAGFDVLVPEDPELGQPDAYFVDPDIGQGHVTLVWAAGDDLEPITAGSNVGLIVTQFRGSLDEGYFAKLIASGTKPHAVDVGDATGYWIDGDIHFFFYTDPGGRPVDDTRRLVGDVLAFERDGLTVRIETASGLERALAIAESLR